MSIRDLTPPRRIAWRSARESPGGDLPEITLITPSLDRADLVGAAVESAWGQGHPRLRHIVVDGGSTDGTLAVLDRYPEVEVVAQRSVGSHAAMNEGLARAGGEVIGFLNTDDLLLPGTLLAAARAFAADPALDALRFRAALFERATGSEVEATAEIVEPPRSLRLDELMFGTPGFNAWFFRRRVFDAHGTFDPELDVAADRDFLLRLHLGRARLDATAQYGYAYRRHPGSRTLDRAARLRLQILGEHVAIARRLLSRSDLAAADRAALVDWHGYEAARLLAQWAKAGRLGSCLALAAEAFIADAGWPLRAAAARRRSRELKAAVNAAPATPPMPA